MAETIGETIQGFSPSTAKAPWPDDDRESLATRAEGELFCVDCGRLFVGRATDTEHTWKVTAHPWWTWFLIALGVALTATFGLVAWQAARERSAMRESI